ncbi:hypothetical protein EG68_10653 [Paragonimus skrjabini miyazakii]|uniref:SOWAHA-C winged helix-turn-helix domain-containing protein n=1 Tax=Paragonimus skrjabini miyazakii TaxID=59628 RepID=A0A8S9YCL6_9TREM|nr:hypothetical protein EG68_10653 [Paragonimus skrjabini miyazakii]
MDLKLEVARAIEGNGGRILCSQLVNLFQTKYISDEESKRAFKKAVSAVAVVEQGEDKRRYLILKEVAKNKENIANNSKSVISQSTQTLTSRLMSITPSKLKTSKTTTAQRTPEARKSYSTYTSNEPRRWWLACSECRHADMARLLGLNSKLVNWSNPVDGTALHYAAKVSNTQCMRFLLKQYNANVDARSRGQTPLHVAVLFSQSIAIRLLVEEFSEFT